MGVGLVDFFFFVMGCGGGGDGCGCGCDCCLLQKIYYFIIMDILYYYIKS